MNVKEYQLANTQQYEQMIQSKNGWGQEIIVRSHINNNADIDWYYSSYIKDFKTRPVNATLVKSLQRTRRTMYVTPFHLTGSALTPRT